MNCCSIPIRIIHKFNEMNDINFIHAILDFHYTKNIPCDKEKNFTLINAFITLKSNGIRFYRGYV